MARLLFSGIEAYLLLVACAVFVHICYQLSVSILSHLSVYSLSHRATVRRLLSLGTSYALGAFTATVAALLTIVALTNTSSLSHDEAVHWLTLVAVGTVPLIGLLTILLYYRRGAGTRLWLPRPFADYLVTRAQKTKSAVEAFSLGITTVIGELPFIAGPLLLVAITIAKQPTETWLSWSAGYAFTVSLPLLLLTFYLTSGHSIARIQRWREENKHFLQWTSGLMLVLLTLYVVTLQFGVAT